MTTGRPREFDLDERLDRAVAVFWRQGYEGTALSDLTAAMGINRPSLYAAYGNKESLYRKALDRYADRADHVREAFEQPTARACAETLLRGTVAAATGGDAPGCLMVQGALATGEQAGAVRDETAARRHAAEAALCRRFEQARRDGDLAPDADVRGLAQFVGLVWYGVAVQAAGGATPEELHRAVDIAMSAFPSPRGTFPAP
ncbi:TetR/AcrR family transcriptional regulator [Streptomyces sp. AV19]|uniref:TetR/AcrR family transcriptional regulator n=1 Tax=Streptomyces sp. AV19 TaxID=2793068 RepID=UPI0018FE45D0|nr:TetR/AcrR family transcriptional regulator [Streptomyces sp. AV19]MBH1933769.1 TetR/AcrR family transcriptional regulator [Streptomyces sp. AV19]MDG4535727.1 TetR/AcrR family transcriptional regulator [Streptomyces sp. AV19]